MWRSEKEARWNGWKEDTIISDYRSLTVVDPPKVWRKTWLVASRQLAVSEDERPVVSHSAITSLLMFFPPFYLPEKRAASRDLWPRSLPVSDPGHAFPRDEWRTIRPPFQSHHLNGCGNFPARFQTTRALSVLKRRDSIKSREGVKPPVSRQISGKHWLLLDFQHLTFLSSSSTLSSPWNRLIEVHHSLQTEWLFLYEIFDVRNFEHCAGLAGLGLLAGAGRRSSRAKSCQLYTRSTSFRNVG